METQYLNHDVRREIRGNVEQDVSKKIGKSEVGKELRQLKSQLEKEFRKIARIICPKKDLEVLEKYELISTHERFFYSLDSKNIIQSSFYRKRSSDCEVAIKPAINTHKMSDYNYEMGKIINKDKDLQKLCVDIYKINDHLSCELDETVIAYMSRVESFRTVKTLLLKYPGMKKYIPKPVKKEKEPAETKEENVIKLFEAS